MMSRSVNFLSIVILVFLGHCGCYTCGTMSYIEPSFSVCLKIDHHMILGKERLQSFETIIYGKAISEIQSYLLLEDFKQLYS